MAKTEERAISQQKAISQEKVVCETPTPGKATTRIVRWKYELVAEAILKILPHTGEGVVFMELPDLVAAEIAPERLAELGSVGWYTTTVKLDLEVKGKIARVLGVSPQRLLRCIK